jgi:processive 1,2-diacylglycerol beta-glucosyltransferase
MNKLRVQVVFEHGADYRPFGSASLRLLRPLGHPALKDRVEMTSGPRYDGQAADWVIVDRLWRPDISLALAAGLISKIRGAGARFLYAIDDNFLQFPETGRDRPFQAHHRRVVEWFLSQADGVIATTLPLREQMLAANRNVVVVPNNLDERLLVRRGGAPPGSPFGQRRKVIGYMGTMTHEEDLAMIAPSLREIALRHPNQVKFDFVGVRASQASTGDLADLPARWLSPAVQESEYPLFMLWFTTHAQWDIAISPLQDTPFNRCKSDIKFLDYSAIGAAGVYSRAPTYESTVRHGETGLLAENRTDSWVEALETLLTDNAMRARIAENATRYLFSERILARTASRWLEALDRLSAGFGSHD